MARANPTKVSLRELGLDKAKIKEVVGNGGKHRIARFAGVIHTVEHTESDYAQTSKFRGSFKGTNVLNGRVINGSLLYVPPSTQGTINQLVDKTKKEGVGVVFDVYAEAGKEVDVLFSASVVAQVDVLEAVEVAAVNDPLPAPVEEDVLDVCEGEQDA